MIKCQALPQAFSKQTKKSKKYHLKTLNQNSLSEKLGTIIYTRDNFSTRVPPIKHFMAFSTWSRVLAIHWIWWLHMFSLNLVPILSLIRISPFILHSFASPIMSWTRSISTWCPFSISILWPRNYFPINKQITWNSPRVVKTTNNDVTINQALSLNNSTHLHNPC